MQIHLLHIWFRAFPHPIPLSMELGLYDLPMKTSTFQIIIAAIGADETITADQRDAALSILEGAGAKSIPRTTSPRKRCNYGNMLSAATNAIRDARETEYIPIKPGYVRRAEAARYLGISIRTLSKWMSMHLIAYSKVSHRVCLFRLKDLDATIERLRYIAVGE